MSNQEDASLKMAQEIEEKRKLPQEIKEGIDKTFFYNNIMAIVIMLYFVVINISYKLFNDLAFERIMKYLEIIMIIGTIIVFELSYRKDNMKIALIGIEVLICSLLSVYIPYIYLYTNPIYRNMMIIIPIFFAIYYIGKTIVAYILREYKHRSNLSDVKEIISYEENKSYLEEESTKTLKEEREKKKQEKYFQNQDKAGNKNKNKGKNKKKRK